MSETAAENKRDFFLHLLAENVYVGLHIDARRENVIVPQGHKATPNLVLHYALNAAVPIPDIEADVAGVGATLSFERTPVHTFIPWDSVFAIAEVSSGVGRVYPDDIPADVRLNEPEAPPAKKTPPTDYKARHVGGPKLGVVLGDAEPFAPDCDDGRCQNCERCHRETREKESPGGMTIRLVK